MIVLPGELNGLLTHGGACLVVGFNDSIKFYFVL